jgi:hypothetical protein
MDMRNACKVYFRNLKGIVCLGDLDVNDRIVLKKQDMRALSKFIWLRTNPADRTARKL